MHWKFDPFFSIAILRLKSPSSGSVSPVPLAKAFWIEPTANTQQRLLDMGWVFKPYPTGGGGRVYAEKTVDPDGNAALRSKPAPEEGLTFLLQLSDATLLKHTAPFDAKNADLPSFSGRARLLYFDNLHAVADNFGAYQLSKINAVEAGDLGSRVPAHFMYRPSENQTLKVEMNPLAPNGIPYSFNVNPKTETVEIQLPENGYQLTQKPSGKTETLYLTDETLPVNTIGVLRIFKPPGADWEPNKQYRITFREV